MTQKSTNEEQFKALEARLADLEQNDVRQQGRILKLESLSAAQRDVLSLFQEDLAHSQAKTKSAESLFQLSLNTNDLLVARIQTLECDHGEQKHRLSDALNQIRILQGQTGSPEVPGLD